MEKESKEREKSKEEKREKGKGNAGKGWVWSQNGKGKGKGRHSMYEWMSTQCANLVDELWRTTTRSQTTRSEDDLRGVASSDEASEVDGHQDQSRQSTVLVQQQVRGHREGGGDESKSGGGCEEERGEAQVGSECRPEGTEGRKKDPNFVGLC